MGDYRAACRLVIVALLDGQDVRAGREVLVIADEKKVVGLAASGGLATAVRLIPRNFLGRVLRERTVVGRADSWACYGASLRFERGVILRSRCGPSRGGRMIRPLPTDRPGPC